MNISILKTLRRIEKELTADAIAMGDLYRAYEHTLRLRSQLLGVIHDREMFEGKSDDVKLSDLLSEGYVTDASVTLTISEPLPTLKELTSAVQEHWVELMHAAIDKAAEKSKLPYFAKAFVWIAVTTPRGANNAQLWDTSNRAVNLIINNLKGIFFADDNLGHMAFGVAGKWGEKGVTIVRILPFDELDRIAAG
jgi:hypothetical protein